jgi:CBS domain-containing protein
MRGDSLMVTTAYELATAYELGRKDLVFCDIDDSIPKIAQDLRSKDIGSMFVRSGDGYAGIITEDGVLGAIAEGVDVLTAKVRDMKLDPIHTLHKEAPLSEVSRLFATTGTTRLGVVDDEGQIVAVVKRKNLQLLDRFKFVDRAARHRTR